MRYTQYRAFEKHLQSSFSSHLYCLIVKDPGERGLALDELKRRGPCETKTMVEEKELIAELETFSLFSHHRLLHFQGCEKLSKNTQGRLEKKIGSLPEGITLVLSGESFSRQSAFYKLCEKHGVILDTGEEKEWEKEKGLTEWLLERAHFAKKTIEPSAVKALVSGTKGSFAILLCEWEKLLTYLGEKTSISLRDVEEIASLGSNDSNWALGEAILEQNSKEALEAAHRMVEQGTPLFSLLRSLRYQMTTALQLTVPDREWISQKFPHLKGQRLEKQIHAATQFGSQRLMKSLQTIDALEFKAKDGCDDPKLLLTLLCAKLVA